jgi:CTP synthase
MTHTKYIFVTGGVTSSLGKGIIAASLAKLLQSRGYEVTIQKFDPYINIDPGTLNPYEHGECFVTDDGAETDLDLGHYERYLNTPTSKSNNVTTGKIYQSVINKERKGEFLGKTVQVIPHITDEIKARMTRLEKEQKYDIIITEIGGTVGDIESLPYIEAVRQLKWELGRENAMVIHLTLIPYLSAAGELKTKPTQHSVKTLMESGVSPDILVCRTEHELTESLKNKLALFCNVQKEEVIQAIDAETIYDVPNLMLDEGLDKVVLKKLGMPVGEKPVMKVWNEFLHRFKNPKNHVRIGLVGKYLELKDSYKSILESFIHAGAVNEVAVEVVWIHAEALEKEDYHEQFKDINAILVAPGFGKRGVEGKINAVTYAREQNIPFLGICFGMQMAIIEFARNVLKLADANSIEVDEKTSNPLISLMEEQKSITNLGGTMRLGAWECKLSDDSLIKEIYEQETIMERHRHRYEFNNKYLTQFEEAGMKASGKNPKAQLVEVIELTGHKWFVGVQFHPEYKSTVLNPHPLFISFVKAALEHQKNNI